MPGPPIPGSAPAESRCVCVQKLMSSSTSSQYQLDDAAAAADIKDDEMTVACSSQWSAAPTLSQLCRSQLRRHLVTVCRVGALLIAVNCLPLPPTLQRFLLLDELDSVQ